MTILFKADVGSDRPVHTPVMVFTDRDMAVMYCAKYNEDEDFDVCYYLKDVPTFQGINNIEIEREGSDMSIQFGEEGYELHVEIRMEKEHFETLNHQYTQPVYHTEMVAKGLSINGTGIDVLNLSEELTRELNYNAEQCAKHINENL